MKNQILGSIRRSIYFSRSKTRGQLNGLLENGVDAELIYFSFNPTDKTLEKISEKKVELPKGKWFLQLKRKRALQSAISEYLKQSIDTDYFLIRYFGGSKDLLNLVKEKGKHIVFETQNAGYNESLNLLKKQKFIPKIGWLLGIVESIMIPLILTLVYQRRTFKKAKLVVTVTNEIKERLNLKNCIVIPNGINIS